MSNGGCTAKIDKQGEVGSEVQRLSSAIGQLDSAVGHLYERLASVLAQPKECEKTEATPQEPLVPLALEIRAETEVLHSIIRRLGGMHEQVEL